MQKKYQSWAFLILIKKVKAQSSPPRYVFIDTQIIQYSADKNKSKSQAFWGLFNNLKKQRLELAISEIVIFESLFGRYGKKQEEGYKYLSQFIKKAVEELTLLAAAEVGGLYIDEGFSNIKPGDQIIAATAFLEKGLILTRNYKDFPSPFFKEIEWFPTTYKIKGRYKETIDVCLYEPRYKLIVRRIKEKDKASS